MFTSYLVYLNYTSIKKWKEKKRLVYLNLTCLGKDIWRGFLEGIFNFEVFHPWYFSFYEFLPKQHFLSISNNQFQKEREHI